jgi:hypothetical protein
LAIANISFTKKGTYKIKRMFELNTNISINIKPIVS